MAGAQYIIEVHSSNLPTVIVGTFTPVENGIFILKMYSVGVNLINNGGESNYINYNAGTLYCNSGAIGDCVDEVTANQDNTTYRDKFAYFAYNDTSYSNNTLTVYLKKGGCNGTNVVVPVTIETNSLIYMQNATQWANDTLCVQVGFSNPLGINIPNYYKNVQEEHHYLADSFMKYYTEGQKNWFFTIFLSVIAIYATASVALWVNFAIIGLGVFFIMVHWYTLGYGVLGVSLVISILIMIKGRK
jgi:hypothetical protein